MRYIKPIVWTIFILSGASGLIYEVIWMRQLTLIFGSTIFATSTVLTAFMAGLAFGSFYFGRKIDDSTQSPLRFYAILEVGIGVFCVAWPLILTVLSGFYVLIHRHVTSEFYTLSLLRFALTFLVLLIPSTLMGGTLPVLTRFFVPKLEKLGTNVGILYALNTFGAVIGCVAAAFFLIEHLGVQQTLFVGIAINFVVALVAFLFGRGVVHSEDISLISTEAEENPADAGETTADTDIVSGHSPLQRLVLVAIGISGFCALAYEVLWTRILVFFLGSTTYAFATMLAAFLFGIGLGSFLFARWTDRLRAPTVIFGILQLGIGLSALLLMPAFEELYGMSRAFQSVFGGARFWAFFSCFLVMSVPTVLMGASFPLVGKIYTGGARRGANNREITVDCKRAAMPDGYEHRASQNIGRSIGNVYAVNTVGSILGAFCAGFILIPLLGIRPSLVMIVVLNTALGCLLIVRAERRTPSAFLQGISIGVPILSVGLAVIMLLTVNQPLFLKSAIFKTQRPGDTLVDYNEEVDATVTTLKDNEGVYRLYVDTNQAADASRWDSPSHRVIAHLPLLLHRRPKRALVVGFGMGLTSHSITQHGVRVDAVELSEGVLQAAKKHFTHINRNVFENKLFNWTLNDGRNHILMTRQKYDMISTGIIHPLVSAGSSNIYTSDFYRLCKRIMTEDGVMCQWVPLHRLPETHYKMIVRTFIEVFPNTTLWYKYTPDFVILIGTHKQLSINYKSFIERARIASIRNGLASDDLDGMSLLDSFMMGPKAVRRYVGRGPIHSDNRPRLEFFKGAALVNTTAQNITGMLEYRERVTPYLINYGRTHEAQKEVRQEIERYFRATQKLIQGQIAYANARYDNAAALMSEAVSINPADETIRYNFGVVSGLIREGEQEELKRLQEEVQRTLTRNPDDIQGHLYLATLYEMQGELVKATNELEEVLRRAPDRFDAYMLLGPLYERQERYQDALRTYQRLEQQDENLPGPIFAAMAQLHLILKNLDEAERYGQKGISVDANSWRSHYILAIIDDRRNRPQQQRQHYVDALEALELAIRLAPTEQDLQRARKQIQKELADIGK